MVFSGLVIAWRLATCPTSRSPVLVKATIDGVVRPPSSLAMTLGSPPSITATQELVVPRSIPIILAMLLSFVSMLPRPALGYGRWRQAPIFTGDQHRERTALFLSTLESMSSRLSSGLLC